MIWILISVPPSAMAPLHRLEMWSFEGTATLISAPPSAKLTRCDFVSVYNHSGWWSPDVSHATHDPRAPNRSKYINPFVRSYQILSLTSLLTTTSLQPEFEQSSCLLSVAPTPSKTAPLSGIFFQATKPLVATKCKPKKSLTKFRKKL